MTTKPTRTQLERFCCELMRALGEVGWGGRYARIGARWYYQKFEKKAKKLGVKGKDE